MTTLSEMQYAGPRTIGDALQVRAEHPGWVVLAGGTDLMVPSARVATVDGVLDLFGIDELHGVHLADGTVRVAACTTYAELLASAVVHDCLPMLAAAAREVGAVQIRQRGTIGGNIITSSPVGDMLPGLLALDAAVVLASPAGARTVAYESFLAGYRRVGLGADELLVAVEVPVPEPGTVQHWRKVGTRAAQAVTKVSIAATALAVAGHVVRARMAFGAVANRPVRLSGVEQLMEGAALDGALPERVGAAVREALDPISDVRSTAGYRRDVAGRLAARFVSTLVSPA